MKTISNSGRSTGSGVALCSDRGAVGWIVSSRQETGKSSSTGGLSLGPGVRKVTLQGKNAQQPCIPEGYQGDRDFLRIRTTWRVGWQPVSSQTLGKDEYVACANTFLIVIWTAVFSDGLHD